MTDFVGDNLLLGGDASLALYEKVKALPIIDYHCHLDPKIIAEDGRFDNIGEFWLAGDHYKWRAMRLCGVDEKYITGNADFREKFIKYAEIVPKLCGNPLYYWTHMELRRIFGITKPLCAETASEIYEEASAKLKNMSVLSLLESFKVEYIATTDDPVDDLRYHGKHGSTTVAPTFRPDKIYGLDREYLDKLGAVSGKDTTALSGVLEALSDRLDYFCSKGCRIADHGFEKFPLTYIGREEAEAIFLKKDPTAEDKEKWLGFILGFLMKEYKKRGMTAQIHFGVTRNVNPPRFAEIGVDSGFDVMSTAPAPERLIAFLASIPDEERPEILLYTLNDGQLASLACAAGAFRKVRMGAAWWFNDTVLGIEKNLDVIAEYASLGRSVGMLTDSRSFSSYVRFDFFRRILARKIGRYVESGEYDVGSAEALMTDICYNNPKELIK